MLARVGFEVREASDGAEAIELWQQLATAADLDGHAHARRHRPRGHAPKIKRSPRRQRDHVIIALTASAFEEDPATARAAGCDDFVRKPIRMPEVFAKLREHLGCVYTTRTPPPHPPHPASVPQTPSPACPPPGSPPSRAPASRPTSTRSSASSPRSATRPPTADALDDLARRFNYDQIVALTRAALAGGPS
jgi:CheY-like chemotaxis protein